MTSEALVAFECECRELGIASSAAKLRLDEAGPPPYVLAYKAYRGTKRFEKNYFARKLLSLRLSAVKRGMAVDGSVTAGFLERITDGRCPVTLQPLSTADKSPDNPSVDRLVNEVTYRAGNICVLSRRANLAKGDRSFENVLQIAQSGEPLAGMQPLEWMRLASLMYGAWSRAYRHADPYLLPLAAIPGAGMFTSTSQVVQLLLTREYARPNVADVFTARWLELTKEAGCRESVFLELRDRLTCALGEEEHPGNAWLHGAVFEAFVAWYTASSSVVVPAVEGLLSKHQARIGDPAATSDWPTTSRYAR